MGTTDPLRLTFGAPVRDRPLGLTRLLVLIGFATITWFAFQSQAGAEEADGTGAEPSEATAASPEAAPPAKPATAVPPAEPATAAPPVTGAATGDTGVASTTATEVAPAPGPDNEGQVTTDLRAATFGNNPDLAAAVLHSAAIDAGLEPDPRFVAAAGPVSQCNGTDNLGGLAVECDVTITNTLDLASGVGSSVVTLRECHGVANAAPTCTTSSTPSATVTTSVTQCNGSGSGGGGTVTCRVDFINNITGTAPTSAVTVNQCNGSGQGGGTPPTTVCTPAGAAPSATVTQCNDSGNGGGATMRVRCTVSGSSTQTSALPVTLDQCNGSGNGGGSFVVCSASVTNNFTAAAPPAPTPPAPAPLSPAPTPATPTVFDVLVPQPALPLPASVPSLLPISRARVAGFPASSATPPLSGGLPRTGSTSTLLLVAIALLVVGGFLAARRPREASLHA